MENTMKQLLGDQSVYTHMPYIHDAGGSVAILLCLSDKVINENDEPSSYRAWKIHSYDPSKNTFTRVETGADPLDVEASPVCYYRDGKFNMSFMRGKWVSGPNGNEYRDLRLYKMTGKSLFDLDDMEQVLPFRVNAGFEWYGKAVFATDGRIMHDNIDGIGRYETEIGLKWIFRMVPRHDHTTSVLVTGIRGQNEKVTLLYDLDSRQVIDEIKTPDGKATYKPSIFEKTMAHAVWGGDGIEEYKVEFLKDIDQTMPNIVLR